MAFMTIVNEETGSKVTFSDVIKHNVKENGILHTIAVMTVVTVILAVAIPLAPFVCLFSKACK
jgi:hypothetical protein